MHERIRKLLAALNVTFCRFHEIQFAAPWNRSPGRC
jgi:hypothetical protein